MILEVRNSMVASGRFRPVTRRELLRMAAAGTGAAALGPVMVGCGTEQPGAADGNAKETGTLTLAMAQEFLDLDPMTSKTGGTNIINSFVYETLYRQDPFPPRAEIFPELAVGLPEQKSPTVYRIKLREDVTFHDGSPFTAEDVVFTFDTMRDPKTNSTAGQSLGFIDAMTVVNPAEVEIVLKAPTTLLTQRLVSIRGIVSKSAVKASPDALKLAPVGTGPYRLESAVSGQRVVLERFDGYTGGRELSFQTLELRVVVDDNARVSGLLTGEWRAINNVLPSAVQNLKGNEGISVGSEVGYGGNLLMFHCGRPPFDDVRLRQAVLYAIDREAITKTSYFGEAESGGAGVLPPIHPEFVESPTVYQYDPDKARQLLAEAGADGEPVPVQFLIPDAPEGLASQSPIIEQNLRDVGFAPKMIFGEQQAHVTRVTEGNYHAALVAFDASGTGSGAEQMLRSIYTKALPEQFLFWQTGQTSKVEDLLDQALVEADPARFGELIAEVQWILQEQVPAATLHFSRNAHAWSDDLQGYRPSPTAQFVLDGVRG